MKTNKDSGISCSNMKTRKAKTVGEAMAPSHSVGCGYASTCPCRESQQRNPYTLSDALIWIASGSNEIDSIAPGDYSNIKIYRDSVLAGALAFVSEERENILRAVNCHEEMLDALKTLHQTFGKTHQGYERCEFCKVIAKAEGR